MKKISLAKILKAISAAIIWSVILWSAITKKLPILPIR